MNEVPVHVEIFRIRLSKLHIATGSSKQGVWNGDEVEGCAYGDSDCRKGWEHYIVRSVDRRFISIRGKPGRMEIASHLDTINQVSSIITVSEQQPVGHLLEIVTGCRLMVESLLWEFQSAGKSKRLGHVNIQMHVAIPWYHNLERS